MRRTLQTCKLHDNNDMQLICVPCKELCCCECVNDHYGNGHQV